MASPVEEYPSVHDKHPNAAHLRQQQLLGEVVAQHGGGDAPPQVQHLKGQPAALAQVLGSGEGEGGGRRRGRSSKDSAARTTVVRGGGGGAVGSQESQPL